MLNPGDTFGDYKVIRLLGKGGMGSVFLLENAEGAQVAAKILDPESSHDEESRKRFLREAQLAIGVKHPNLVETYDIGEDPDTGLCYILMEYVPGGSLADRLKTGPLSVNDAIRITYQIAAVLELARQKGIVHRDIKPDNIMFGADGKAKLTDLGIARGGVGGVGVTTVTQTGMMIGTPAYMAPEQMLDAHNVDSRADIYSLGIVFYEMLAGKRPNADDTVVQLMAKAVAGEPIPDVRTLRPEVSASIAELIGLMCAMKADERVQTPAEVTMALSQITHGREVTIRRKAPKAVKAGAKGNFIRIAVLSAVFLALAGFGILGYVNHSSKTVAAATKSVVEAVKDVPVKTLPAKVDSKTDADVTDPSVQLVVDMNGTGPRFARLFSGAGPLAGELSVPKNVQYVYFAPLSELDLSRVNVLFWGATWSTEESGIEKLLGFVRAGGTLVMTSHGFSPLFQERLAFRTRPAAGEIGEGVTFEGFDGAVPGEWRELSGTDGYPEAGNLFVRNIGRGRIVLARHLALFRPRSFYFRDDAPFTGFWRKFLSDSATFGKRVSVRTPFPPEDPETASDVRYDCCGFRFYANRNERLFDLRPVMERFLPLLDQQHGGTLRDNGVRRVFSAGGVIDIFEVNGRSAFLPQDVFMVGSADARRKISAMGLFAFGATFSRGHDCGEYLGAVPMHQYASALAVQAFLRDSAGLLGEDLNDYDRKHIWDVSEVIATGAQSLEPHLRIAAGQFKVLEELRAERPGFVPEYFRKVRETRTDVRTPQGRCAVLSKLFGRDLAPRFARAYPRFDFAAATREYDRLCGKAVAEPPRGVTDRRIRYAKVGERNWFYSLENGEAVLWRGQNGYNNETKPCVEPAPEGEIAIPSELDGHKVTVIGTLAFFRCGRITSVTIPEGVREVRGWAFLDCDSLADVGIPATMESMKSCAFCSCRALRSVDIGKCADILGSTFWNCSSLEEIRVSPDNPSYVSGDGMLLARKSSTLVFHSRMREAVAWPRNLREIGEGAFLNSRIRELDVPDSVEKIGKNAFFNCHSLVRIGFGSGLREVEGSAFRFCGRLRELDFPKSLVRLESSVADGCQALKRVVFRGDAPTVDLAHGSVLGKVSDKLEILVVAGTKGWNGPGSSDLPEKWPAGNFDDSRQIRHLGTQADDPAQPDVSSLVVEAPVEFAKEKAKLEEMLGKIVPALNALMGGTLKTSVGGKPRKIVLSDRKGWSVSQDGDMLTMGASMSGFPKQTTGVGERVAVFLSGLGRRDSAHTESCAGAMDWYLSFRLRELLGGRFDGSEKFRGDLSKVGSGARKLDPDMTLYDLWGESQNRKAKKLTGSEKSRFAQEKCFWLFEQMRARNGDAIAGFLKAWEREQAAGNLADPVSQDDVAALFSIAVGEDLFDWFSEHGMPSSSDRTHVKAKFTGASTPEGWLDDLEIAKARAKTSGKMILAAFEGSDWCGWCKKMEKDVYTQPDFMPRVTPRFVPVYIDSPRDRDLLSEKCRERNPELHREYNVRGVPCVVILDAEGKEIGRVGGYKQNVDELMERVDALVGRAQDPSANVCRDEKRKRKTGGKTSTPTGMTDDFEAACEQAKKEKKRMLLVFSGSDWCGFCKRLDDDVLSEKKFIRQVSRKYVPVYVDNPRDRSLLSAKAQDRNPGLIDRYSPNGYPTVVVTDADGEELARFSGYGGGGSSAFMRRLEDSVKESERENKRRK